MADGPRTCFPYLHEFNGDEQDRLYCQAEFMEQLILRDVDFADRAHVLEVGCGVGAQTAILLRRYPRLKITSIDASESRLARAAEINWTPTAILSSALSSAICSRPWGTVG